MKPNQWRRQRDLPGKSIGQPVRFNLKSTRGQQGDEEEDQRGSYCDLGLIVGLRHALTMTPGGTADSHGREKIQ
jgi:hypothetical protein